MGSTTLMICPGCDALVDGANAGTSPSCPHCGRPLHMIHTSGVAAATGDPARPGDVRHALEVLDRLWAQALERHRTSTIEVGGLIRLGVTPTRAVGLLWLAVGVLFAGVPAGGGVLTVMPRWVTAALALALCVAAARHEINGALAYGAERSAYRASRSKLEAGRPLERGDWGNDPEHDRPIERPRRIGLWLAIYAAIAVLGAGIALGGADGSADSRWRDSGRIELPTVAGGSHVIDADRLRTVAEIWTWAGAAATVVLVGVAMSAPRAK